MFCLKIELIWYHIQECSYFNIRKIALILYLVKFKEVNFSLKCQYFKIIQTILSAIIKKYPLGNFPLQYMCFIQWSFHKCLFSLTQFEDKFAMFEFKHIVIVLLLETLHLQSVLFLKYFPTNSMNTQLTLNECQELFML